MRLRVSTSALSVDHNGSDIYLLKAKADFPARDLKPKRTIEKKVGKPAPVKNTSRANATSAD